MISKVGLINLLFIAGFPCFGVGSYLSATQRHSIGLLFSVGPWVLILCIYVLDLLYGKKIRNSVNNTYWTGLAFILSLVFSMWYAYKLAFPGLNLINTTSFSINYLVPFHAAIITNLYNRDNKGFDLAKMILTGLAALIVINLMGLMAGVSNLVHSFEGRTSMPFMPGIYSASHVISMINLMLIFYIKDFSKRPVRFVGLSLFFVFNIYLMLDINSRLSIMIFLLVLVLFVTRGVNSIKGLYTISLFTMPLMMFFALLIYKILSLPFLQGILQRVSEQDVTTFNGRTYIWTSAADWLLHDRTGLIFGNGYHGQYQLRLLDYVTVLWGSVASKSYNMHMHSTFLEILMGQGVVGLILFYALTYHCFKYYRIKYRNKDREAPFFALVVYVLFVWQIDIFYYGGMGNAIFFCMLSLAAIKTGYFDREKEVV